MIVNDEYALFLKARAKTPAGAEVVVSGWTAHEFKLERVEISRHHGRTSFKLKDVWIGGELVLAPGAKPDGRVVAAGVLVEVRATNEGGVPSGPFEVMVAGQVLDA